MEAPNWYIVYPYLRQYIKFSRKINTISFTHFILHAKSVKQLKNSSLNRNNSLSGVPVQLVPADPHDRKQAARFSADLDFQVNTKGAKVGRLKKVLPAFCSN